MCPLHPRYLACAGGTRFIGVYLARQLIEAGHDVTLLTRGKKPVTFQIPDDTDESYASYASKVKHIAADRQDVEGLQAKLKGTGFQGVSPVERKPLLVRPRNSACLSVRLSVGGSSAAAGTALGGHAGRRLQCHRAHLLQGASLHDCLWPCSHARIMQ
jgi:hypothetical protein